MKANPYSEQDITTIQNMKRDGASFADIAAATGRTQHAVTMKYYSLRSEGRKALVEHKPVRRKYTKRAQEVVATEQPQQHKHQHKPMIALIGETQDVTKTIKELFS